MTDHTVTCRDCGAVGTEDDDLDPAPGLCPACMHARMRPVMLKALDMVGRRSIDEIAALTELALIEQVGMRPDWARRFVEGDQASITSAIDSLRA